MRAIHFLSARCVKVAAIAVFACSVAGPALAEPTKVDAAQAKPAKKKEFRRLTVLEDGRRVTTMMDVLGIHLPVKQLKEIPSQRPPERRSGGTVNVVVEEKREVPNS